MCNYPENIVNAVFGEVVDRPTPPDLLESIEYCLDSLEEMERELINLRFKEYMTIEEVGKRFNIAKGQTRTIIDRSLRKLRHRSRINIMKYGLKAAAQIAAENANKTLDEKLNMRIEHLDLSSTRAFMALARNGVWTIADILNLIKEGRLLKLKGMGLLSAKDVIIALNKEGFEVTLDEI